VDRPLHFLRLAPKGEKEEFGIGCPQFRSGYTTPPKE